MAIPTFTWDCVSGPTGTIKYRVLTAQFGDGYSQVAADGINNNIQSWPLTFAEKLTVVTAIKTFLDNLQGYQVFYWTPPLGVQGLYRCSQIGVMAETGSNYTLTATFTEAFKP